MPLASRLIATRAVFGPLLPLPYNPPRAQTQVEIEDGGREVIRVIDNGGGIPAAELPMAFAEHATSKLTCDEELFQISTMGFRGEALASIGAVSHARIMSRTFDSEAAYE